SAENSVVMGRVTDALRALGITPENIQTRSVTLNRIDYGPERGRYQAANMVEVRIRDVAKAGPAIAAATEAGGNIVSGPDLRV
ncbi:SIMPL domain-containing protein, partial [Klebsiella pneumoniae]|nr:SIMPL domain-containing protein [Klebsiella pneumoniae]